VSNATATSSSSLLEDYADDNDESDTTDDDDEALLLQNLTTTTTSVPLEDTTDDVVLVSSSTRATVTGGIEENNTTEDCRTITDLICSNEEFSILCKILAETGYDTIFNYHDNSGASYSTNSTDDDELEELYTVFAPNDEAFKQLPRTYAEQLLSSTENMEWLVLYHSIGVTTVEGAVVSSDDLECGDLVRMSNGKNTRTVCESGDAGAVYQKGAGNMIADTDQKKKRQGQEAALALFPEIIEFDIEACNGLVHVVNNIILPKNLPQQ